MALGGYLEAGDGMCGVLRGVIFREPTNPPQAWGVLAFQSPVVVPFLVRAEVVRKLESYCLSPGDQAT